MFPFSFFWPSHICFVSTVMQSVYYGFTFLFHFLCAICLLWLVYLLLSYPRRLACDGFILVFCEHRAGASNIILGIALGCADSARTAVLMSMSCMERTNYGNNDQTDTTLNSPLLWPRLVPYLNHIINTRTTLLVCCERSSAFLKRTFLEPFSRGIVMGCKVRCKVHLSVRYFLTVLTDPYSVCSAAGGGLGRGRAASRWGLLFSFFDPTP